MIAVSNAWQEASKAQFRYQAYLTVTLEVVPPGLRENASVDADSFKNSDPLVIVDASKVQPTLFGSLEPNRIVLDGSCTLLSRDTQTDDWWSNLLLDGVNEVTVTLTFNQQYSFPGIYTQWDLETNSWPLSFVFKGFRSNEQVYSVTVEDVNSATGYFDAPMDDVDKVSFTFKDWSTPNWRARIDEIMFGLYASFDSVNNGRISGATQTSKAFPLADSLPVHTLDITMRNVDKYFDPTLKSGISQYLASQQEIKVMWSFVTSVGVTEQMPEMTYIVNEFTIPEDSQDVTFNLDSRLALLTSTFKKNTYTGSARTLYDLAQYVLQNSNIVTATTGDSPWILPEVLKNFTTLAPIPTGATNTILQYIALASCTWLTTDATTGFIKFFDHTVQEDTVTEIAEDQELGDPTIEINDRLRSISIGVYRYSKKSESEQVGQFQGTLSGTTVVEIQYDKAFADEVSASISGATISSAQYYASYAILTVEASAGGTDVTITLTGKEVVQTITYIQTFRDENVTNGVDVTVENPLVTDTTHLTELTNYIKTFYQRRINYSLSYLGYPQMEPGDFIHVKTIYGEDDAYVTNNTIEFDGGWSGTAEVV